MYEECVFDTLYPVFRGVAGVYRFMPKIGWAILDGKTWSQKALRVLGVGGGAPMFPYVPNYERDGGLAALNEGRFAHNTEYVDDYKYDVRGRLRALRGYADSLRRCGTFDVEAESARLAARLSAFRDTAKVLPPIFATIMTEFDGDIRRYTDHLFGHSAVTRVRCVEAGLPDLGTTRTSHAFRRVGQSAFHPDHDGEMNRRVAARHPAVGVGETMSETRYDKV